MDSDEKTYFLRNIESIGDEGVDFYIKISENKKEDFDVRIHALKVIGIYGDIEGNQMHLDRIFDIARNKDEIDYVRSESLEVISASNSAALYINYLLKIIKDENDDIDVRHVAFNVIACNSRDEKCLYALHELLDDKYFGRFAKNRLP